MFNFTNKAHSTKLKENKRNSTESTVTIAGNAEIDGNTFIKSDNTQKVHQIVTKYFKRK